ncbi:hypothetical protein BD626DRAFT_48563 [Schizophyllum amplum]|uniref:Uncharacterized protein n=1 Tax=Schizophyllum amplum TaxID=97359 RepID=A0A550BSP4_9AGAR|nr:hypothetical protein BD626DRAFT_48563 [Auriculariopsis ampla]
MSIAVPRATSSTLSTLSRRVRRHCRDAFAVIVETCSPSLSQRHACRQGAHPGRNSAGTFCSRLWGRRRSDAFPGLLADLPGFIDFWSSESGQRTRQATSQALRWARQWNMTNSDMRESMRDGDACKGTVKRMGAGAGMGHGSSLGCELHGIK